MRWWATKEKSLLSDQEHAGAQVVGMGFPPFIYCNPLPCVKEISSILVASRAGNKLRTPGLDESASRNKQHAPVCEPCLVLNHPLNIHINHLLTQLLLMHSTLHCLKCTNLWDILYTFNLHHRLCELFVNQLRVWFRSAVAW